MMEIGVPSMIIFAPVEYNKVNKKLMKKRLCVHILFLKQQYFCNRFLHDTFNIQYIHVLSYI